MASGIVTGATVKRALGVEITGKYATVADLDRIVKALGWFTIKATSTSTTTDFGELAVGDYVIQIPDAAATMHYMTVATAGTLPAAAVVDDLYVVLRA